MASTQHTVGTQRSNRLRIVHWLSYNANNSPKTPAFDKRKKRNRKSRAFGLCVGGGGSACSKTGSNTRADTQSTNPPTNNFQALTKSEWVGGHYVLSACCVPCSPSLRTTGGLAGVTSVSLRGPLRRYRLLPSYQARGGHSLDTARAT